MRVLAGPVAVRCATQPGTTTVRPARTFTLQHAGARRAPLRVCGARAPGCSLRITSLLVFFLLALFLLPFVLLMSLRRMNAPWTHVSWEKHGGRRPFPGYGWRQRFLADVG